MVLEHAVSWNSWGCRYGTGTRCPIELLELLWYWNTLSHGSLEVVCMVLEHCPVKLLGVVTPCELVGA